MRPLLVIAVTSLAPFGVHADNPDSLASKELSAGIGLAMATPSLVAASLAAVADIRVSLAAVASIAAHLYAFPQAPRGIGGALLAGARFEDPGGVYMRLLAGVGASIACVQGDACGGGGPAASVELGHRLTREGSVKPVFLLRAFVQFGIANVAVLFVPSVAVGLAF